MKSYRFLYTFEILIVGVLCAVQLLQNLRAKPQTILSLDFFSHIVVDSTDLTNDSSRVLIVVGSIQ